MYNSMIRTAKSTDPILPTVGKKSRNDSAQTAARVQRKLPSQVTHDAERKLCTAHGVATTSRGEKKKRKMGYMGTIISVVISTKIWVRDVGPTCAGGMQT